MERIRRLFNHHVYREQFELLQEAERDRKFCKHDLTHFLDVARISYIYSLEDGGGLAKDTVYAAALLHDIGRYRQISEGVPHDEAGAKLSEIILNECGFTDEEARMIIRAIRGHRGTSAAREENVKGGRGGDKLAEYLYRADKTSRRCFECSASNECKWSDEMKNHSISV